MTKKEVEEAIKEFKQEMIRREMSDDRYFSSGRRKQDLEELRILEKQLKDINDGN